MCDEHMETDEVFAKAIETFGQDNQLFVAVEELGELISAISRVKRDRPGSLHNLLEEIADAKVVIRQLEIMFDYDGTCDIIFEDKVERLRKRLATGRDW